MELALIKVLNQTSIKYSEVHFTQALTCSRGPPGAAWLSPDAGHRGRPNLDQEGSAQRRAPRPRQGAPITARREPHRRGARGAAARLVGSHRLLGPQRDHRRARRRRGLARTIHERPAAAADRPPDRREARGTRRAT